MLQTQDIGSFLAAIRQTESGSFGGNYRLRTQNTMGAYQFMQSQWEEMASLAGMAGGSIADAHTQDLVATYWANRWHKRYGDWGLVAVAWIGGQDSADLIARRGFENTSVIKNPQIKSYVEAVTQAQEAAKSGGYTSLAPGAERMIVEYTGPQGQWLHPIAGASEYSNSFRVPRQNKLGIHGAIDVYATAGTPIVSPVTGTVVAVKSGGKGGFTVTVQGDDGHKYYYAHMDSEARVVKGQQINAGTHLGYVGASGNAAGTSPHLHFKMTDSKGRVVNPFNFLKGSVAGGGAFRPVSSSTTQINQQEDFGDMTVAAMAAAGDRIAGGTRIDPRTLGQVEEEPEEKPGLLTRVLGPR